MDIQDYTVLSKVMPYAKKDEEYKQRLSRCMETEAIYCAVMQSLTAEQRSLLDDYFFATADLNFRLICLAFHCGQISVRKRK